MTPREATSRKVAERWMHGILAKGVRAARRAPKYKKLHIFDFDSTTFRSPLPPDDYEDGEAWWSDLKSLGPPAVDRKPGPEMWRQETVDAMKAAIADPDSYVVVMTGRHQSLQDRIGELLEGEGIKPDELITNPEIGNTTSYKRDEMRYLLRQFPNVREVEFWEDRKDDLRGYEKIGEKLGVKFTPRLVRDYTQEAPPYLGVFLTPESRKELLRKFPPKHGDVQADHVTLAFSPSDEEMAAFRKKHQLGREVPLKVTGYAEDDKGQALVVELSPELASEVEGTPHITLSVAPGVEPLYSKELLGRGSEDVPSVTVRGVIDGGPRMGSPRARPSRPPSPTDRKREIWQEFLQTETRNPDFGKPGHHKERILRKTLYDAGGAGRREVMREWGPYLQRRRGR